MIHTVSPPHRAPKPQPKTRPRLQFATTRPAASPNRSTPSQRPQTWSPTQLSLPDGPDTLLNTLTYRQDAVDQPARVLHEGALEYPPVARQNGIEGDITLRMHVDREGRVKGVDILSSSAPGVFDRSARKTAEGYRFKPAQHHAEPVDVWVRLTLEYRL